MLERGAVLRGGDCLQSEDGRVVRVAAAPEKVMHIVCADQFELARAAYHLGNRHVPVEIGDGYLRIAADHVLGEMLLGLGAKVGEPEAPFEPESGAYGGGHATPRCRPGTAARSTSTPNRGTSMSNDLALARLLQLASPALPVGAYSYSQGLESAVDAGMVHDAASAEVLDRRRAASTPSARLEAPLWWRLHARLVGERSGDASRTGTTSSAARRESAELRAETLQMGYSLQRLLLESASSTDASLAQLRGDQRYHFAGGVRIRGGAMGDPARSALIAYLWAGWRTRSWLR